MAQRLPGTSISLRRSSRRDLPQVRALLGVESERRRQRFDRRLLGDPGYDVYVAEAGDGSLCGLVAIAYVRSLRTGRLFAWIDLAWARDESAMVLGALLEHGEARARRRGCDRVAIATPEAGVPAGYMSGGPWARGDLWVRSLAGEG